MSSTQDKEEPSLLLRRLVSIPLTGLVILLLILIVAPVVLLTVIPYRILVWFLAKYFRHDLSGFVEGLSAVLSLDTLDKPDMNALAYIFVDGKLTAEQMIQLFQERVLGQPCPGNRKLLFREKLGLSLESFLGFNFWRRDVGFKLENHVREYDLVGLRIPDPCYHEGELRDVMSGLLERGWHGGQSPWEFLLVPYEGNKTVIIFRFHHGLLDGFHFQAIIHLLSGNSENVPVVPEKTGWRSYIGGKDVEGTPAAILQSLKVLHELVEHNLQTYSPKTEWTFPVRSRQKSQEYYTSFTEPIPVKAIQELAESYGVSYLSVLSMAVSRSIRRIMEEAGQPLPEKMTALLAKEEQEQITDPSSTTISKTFIGKRVSMSHLCLGMEGPKARKETTAKNIEQSLRSVGTLADRGVEVVLTLSGYLPKALSSFIGNFASFDTLLLSNGPVISQPLSFRGRKLTGMITAMATSGLPIGATVTMFGLNDHHRICVNIHASLFPSKHLFSKLGNYITSELLHDS